MSKEKIDLNKDWNIDLDNSISKYVDHVYYEICKKEDKAIRQKITEYALKNYKEVRFLDEDAINEIISLGITEYLKRKVEGLNNE